MTRMSLAWVLSLVCAAGVGCKGNAPVKRPAAVSTEGGGGGCGAPTVTVDGEVVSGLAHGYAVARPRGADTLLEVAVFDREVRCEDLLRPSREPADGEVSVRAFMGGGGAFGHGVGVDVHTQIGVDVDLASVEPRAPGDRVALCVAEATFTPSVGRFKDRAVTMSGRFEGTFCGVASGP